MPLLIAPPAVNVRLEVDQVGGGPCGSVGFRVAAVEGPCPFTAGRYVVVRDPVDPARFTATPDAG